MSYQQKSGNLLEQGDAEPYIAHQTNCESTGHTAKGIADSIQKLFQYAAPYAHRTTGDEDEPGTVRVYRDPEDMQPTFLGLNAQLRRGAPKKGDTAADRFKLFEQCLDAIIKLDPQPPRIAVPYRIGCGLAGGDWEQYSDALKRFAERSGIDVHVYKDDHIEASPSWNPRSR